MTRVERVHRPSLSSNLPVSFCWLGLFVASLLISTGTFWAFQRGASDFSVFFEAWRLVLSGRGSEIYHATPDRFLYAPGFAWLISPLGILPRGMALALWCFGKAAIIGLMIRAFGARLLRAPFPLAAGFGAWAVVLCARPILIDFQYGQVNLFVLAACTWALLSHFRRSEADLADFISWALLGMAAVIKLIPAPLLLVQLFVTRGIPARRILLERIGVLVGAAIVVILPFVACGVDGGWHLLLEWKAALIAKGLPLESHNQSFSAFLTHYFSGNPTHVIANGSAHPAQLGWAWLSSTVISILTLAWSVVAGGFVVGWIVTGSSKSPLRWACVAIASLILPSHLIWKPYFVMGLPALIMAVASWRRTWPFLLFFGLLSNFSGFDWIGPNWGARIEAGSIFLWLHLMLIVVVANSEYRPPEASPARGAGW